jgi:hypothetical protein
MSALNGYAKRILRRRAQSTVREASSRVRRFVGGYTPAVAERAGSIWKSISSPDRGGRQVKTVEHADRTLRRDAALATLAKIRALQRRGELPETGIIQVHRQADGTRRFVPIAEAVNPTATPARPRPAATRTAADRRRRLAALEAGLEADRRARLERLTKEMKTAAAQRSGSAFHAGVETYRGSNVPQALIVSERIGSEPARRWR